MFKINAVKLLALSLMAGTASGCFQVVSKTADHKKICNFSPEYRYLVYLDDAMLGFFESVQIEDNQKHGALRFKNGFLHPDEIVQDWGAKLDQVKFAKSSDEWLQYKHDLLVSKIDLKKGIVEDPLYLQESIRLTYIKREPSIGIGMDPNGKYQFFVDPTCQVVLDAVIDSDNLTINPKGNWTSVR